MVLDDFAVVAADYPVSGDYATITEAIAAGYYSIYVMSGLYLTDESITVPTGVRIYGESQEGVVIDFLEDDWGFILTGYGARVSGLRVLNAGSASGAFLFNVAENARVEDCRIDACVRAATFTGSTFCHFSENWVQGSHLETVYIGEISTDNRIARNRLLDGHHYGVQLEGAFNKVLDNTIAGCEHDGILVASKTNTIHGNTCNQNENGIYVAKENGDHNSIIGNICNNNNGYGININSLENCCNIAIGNSCRDNGVADIRFVPGNQVAFNDAETVV